MSDQLSMREVARRLGVSQIRVRELIRKGTISAEKVTENGGERWSVSEASVSAYEARRAENTSGAAGEPAAGPTSTPERRAEAVPSEAAAANPSLGTLVGELSQQAQRIRTLIAEIEKASAYLDGLRAAQRSIESELARARERAGSPPTPAPPKDKPKKAAKKPASAQKGGGPKASGGAEMKAAAPQADAPSEPMKGAGPAATEPKRTEPADTAVGAALREAGVEGAEKSAPKKSAKKTTKKKKTSAKSKKKK